MKRYTALLSFFLPLTLYMATVAPDLTFFDSGELITGSFTLGLSHPPGYPVYIMLTHLSRYLPIGTIAFKVNCVSALFGGLCGLLTYIFAKDVYSDKENKELLALFASLTFSVSYTVWSQAVVAEVYCFSTLLIGSSIYLAYRFVNEGRRPYLYTAVFLTGVGMGLHYTALVIFPIVLFAVYKREKGMLVDLREYMICLAFFFMGLSVLLYLPFRAWQNEALIWGDPQNLDQLLWVLQRKGYDIPGPERSLERFLGQMQSFNLYREFGVAALIFVVFGAFVSFRKKNTYTFIAVIVLLVLNVGVVWYGNPVEENIFLLESFHTPGYMILAIFVAGAIAELSVLVQKIKIKSIIAVCVLGLLSLFATALTNYSMNDWSQYFIAYDYGKNVLKSSARDSVLFTWGDSGAFPLWYMQKIERYRTDMLLLHCPHLDAYWYWNDKPGVIPKERLYAMWTQNQKTDEMVRFILRDLSPKRPIHFDYSTKYTITLPGIFFMPDGLVYTYTEAPRPAGTKPYEYFVTRGVQNFWTSNVLKDLDSEKAVSIYAYCMYDTGINLLMNNNKEGRTFIRTAVDILPALKPQAASVLGGL